MTIELKKLIPQLNFQRAIKRCTILMFLLHIVVLVNAGEIEDTIDVELKYPNIIAPIAQFGQFGYGVGELNTPFSAAISMDEKIYVVERHNNRVQVFSKDGESLLIFGSRGQGLGEFIEPLCITISDKNEVYVSDAGLDRIIVFNLEGKYLRHFGQHGNGPGDLNGPRGITVQDGKVYIADVKNNRVQILDENGSFIMNIGGYGFSDGLFLHPCDVTVGNNGEVYVCDSENNRIQKFDSNGKFIKAWGSFGSYGGLMATPTDIEFFNNEILVADLINHRLQAFDSDGNYTYQWGRHPSTAHEGNGRTHYPMGLAVSPNGSFIAIVEPIEHRLQIFDKKEIDAVTSVDDLAWWEKKARFHYGTKAVAQNNILMLVEEDTHMALAFDLSGPTPHLIAKFGGHGRKSDNFIMPSGVYYDSDKAYVYITDAGNNRIQVYKFHQGKVMKVAIDGKNAKLPKDVYTFSHTIGGGFGKLNEEFNSPGGIVLGPNRNLYVVDNNNNRIKVYDPDFNVKAVFGEIGSEPGQFNEPFDIKFSPNGDIFYVLDGHNFRVQAFDLENNFLFEWGGPGTAKEEFLYPYGLLVDKEGNVYVTDVGANKVKKFDAKGNFIMEWGSFGTGDGQFYKPKGIAQDWSDPDGKIYVVDFGNHRGQIFTPEGKFLGVFGVGELQKNPKLEEADDDDSSITPGPRSDGDMDNGDHLLIAAIVLLSLVILFLFMQNRRLRKA